jgi:hypothetical protein
MRGPRPAQSLVKKGGGDLIATGPNERFPSVLAAQRPLILAFSPRTGRRDRNGISSAQVLEPPVQREDPPPNCHRTFSALICARQ